LFLCCCFFLLWIMRSSWTHVGIQTTSPFSLFFLFFFFSFSFILAGCGCDPSATAARFYTASCLD
jgi:hypothetical protein